LLEEEEGKLRKWRRKRGNKRKTMTRRRKNSILLSIDHLQIEF
jgi:hypothetical protein